MLELAAVLSLAAACAPTVAPQTLAAIAHVESRFDPLAIGVNRGGPPPRRARDAAEAAVIATRLIDRGANIDLGLAQINSANLEWLGLSVAEAFDPCRNLAAAGAVLQAGYRPAGDAPRARQEALRITLSRYNTGDARSGFRNGYVGKVERAAQRLALTLPPPIAPAASTEATVAPVLLPAAPWDIFARAQPNVLVFSPALIPGSSS